VRLTGPFAFDLQVPEVGARAALAACRATPRGAAPPEGDGRAPGLYLIHVEASARWQLLGFWVVAGTDWLTEGPGPTPDRLPPLAAALLEILVEGLWWRELDVAARRANVWRPLIVIEWSPRLAVRSALPPPGVAAVEGGQHRDEEEDGQWLELGGGPDTALRPRPARVTEDDALSPRRSLLCLVRGRLEQRGSAHTGSYALLPPERLVPDGLPIPMSEWGASLPEGSALPPSDDRLGPPLELPRGGVGYPISGWLLRDLEPWPLRARDVQPGALPPRDVRSEVLTRIAQSMLLTLLVSLPTLALALTVRAVGSPRETSAPEAKTIDPQPAISVCSTHHARYVEQLRCQIEALAAGVDPEVPVCGEPNARAFEPLATRDLQPAWCGLLDRSRDGNELNARRNRVDHLVSWSTFAATQACFNVLGQPEPYLLDGAPGQALRAIGNPESFLDDAELRIQPLSELVMNLDASCEAMRAPLEARVEGAIFATHIGGDGPESGPLRERLLEVGLAEEGELEARCFREGAAFGPDTVGFAPLCGEVPLLPPERAAEDWMAVADPTPADPDPGPSAVDAYADSRFPPGLRAPPSDPLWRCHLELREARDRGATRALWDVVIEDPSGYSVDSGAITRQLALDALLGASRASATDDPCWAVITRRLQAYTPVHPLQGDVQTDSAWSEEQQICGQVCAAAYRVTPGAPGWITPQSDLDECVDQSSPALKRPPVDGVGIRDRLWIPWFGAEGQRRPERSDVCAYNLLAQGLLPPPEGGLLPGALTGVAWAGETSLGSRIAGGKEGAAVIAAENLATYGRSRSRESCGHVATQCFTGLLLDLTEQRPPLDPYLWPQTWSASVSRLLDPQTQGRRPISPWCKEILPYLKPDGVLPEGQFDYPCAKGVEEARQRLGASIHTIATAGEEP
jgi:hypothetical protein